MNNRPAIVVIAYNRPDALARLLSSIESASYPENTHPSLIVSIDKSDSDDVAKVAHSFKYTHGEKTVIERPERMGLKDHVLVCGDITREYGSIIVLEDDLFVAPRFYEYACVALDYTENDGRIGGVSLYNHLFNVHTREAFEAIDDGYDNWYLQIASSWGQAYTKKQWDEFRNWYAVNKDRTLEGPYVPANVSGWSDRSWLKYYIVYLIETGRYCIYPRISMTTNFGDVGSHACKAETDLQVPIGNSKRPLKYDLSTLDESRAVYDAFFEPLGILVDGKVCLGGLPDSFEGDEKRRLTVDLYGYKPLDEIISLCKNDPDKAEFNYILTSKQLPYKVIKSFARRMRPVDANILYGIKGSDIFLYDIRKNDNPPAKEDEALKFLYEYRGLSASRMIKMIKYRFKEKLNRD